MKLVGNWGVMMVELARRGRCASGLVTSGTPCPAGGAAGRHAAEALPPRSYGRMPTAEWRARYWARVGGCSTALLSQWSPSRIGLILVPICTARLQANSLVTC